MLPTLPDYPAYTYVALLVCWLMALGALCWGVRLAFAAVRAAVTTVPRLLDAAWLRLFGASLTAAGSSHWALPAEVHAAGLLSHPEGLPLASWRDVTLHEPFGAHTLVCGPPRSGKSWGVCMPVLRAWPGSVVVSDLRHELFDQTAEARSAYGPVFCFDPASATSCSLNVCDSVRWSSGQAFGDVLRIVHHLILPQRHREPGPFDRPAVALLTGVILHLHDLGSASLPGVCDWMLEPRRSQKEKLEEMLASGNPHVASAARRVLDESDRYRSIVWDAALSPLAVFLDPTIASHTRTSDLDWQDFLSGTHPTSLYLCMQFRDIDRLGVILGALVEALIALLGSPERTPRHRTLLLLDELANLGTLTELERGVSYLQGSGVQVLACVQNLPQLLSLYGEGTPLIAGMHTQLHYRPLDRATSEYLEAMLGPATVLAPGWTQGQSTSQSWGVSGSAESSSSSVTRGTSASVSASLSAQARPLLTADEVRRLPFEAALVLVGGAPPILARKLGVPQPALPQRAWGACVAHPQACASVAGGLLLLLALAPLWHASPGSTVIAHDPRLLLAAVGTPPAPALAAGLPVPEPLPPTTGLPSPEPPALAPVPEVPTSPPLPWSLWYHNTAGPLWSTPGFGPPAPQRQGRYATGGACQEALALAYGGKMRQLQALSAGGTNPGVGKLEQSPLKYHWELGMPSRPRDVHEVWCAEHAQ